MNKNPIWCLWVGKVGTTLPLQSSSFLCKAWCWYADLAVGWHLKVVNCANLCFRLERSWIVSLSSWTNPPHQHSCREGMGVCWFLHWPPYKVTHCFSRCFMNIYMHKLFGKWKLICSRWEMTWLSVFTKEHNSPHSGRECSIVFFS